MARSGKPRRVPTLPKAEDRRPDLVHTSVCPRCGFNLGTFDLNTSSHLRASVIGGQEGPIDPAALLRVQQAWGRIGAFREDCPCGAAIEHTSEITNPSASLIGTVVKDVTRPIVDDVRVERGRLVVVGRFLEGATVRHERGLDFVPAEETEARDGEQPVDVLVGDVRAGKRVACFVRQRAPWALRTQRTVKRAEKLDLRHHDQDVPVAIERHELHLDHPIPPRAGDTLVLTIEDRHGAVSHSVTVSQEIRS